MNKSIKIALLFCFLVTPIVYDGSASEQIWFIDEPMKSRCLCGQVAIRGFEDGEEGVLVEKCTSDWKAVLDSTYTDENGFFKFPDACLGKMYYLRVSLYSFRTLCIKVIVSDSRSKELYIVLEP